MELTGVSYLLQARAMPFFSRRSEYLVKKLLALLSEHSIAILSLDSSPHTAREVQHRSYSRRVRWFQQGIWRIGRVEAAESFLCWFLAIASANDISTARIRCSMQRDSGSNQAMWGSTAIRVKKKKRMKSRLLRCQLESSEQGKEAASIVISICSMLNSLTVRQDGAKSETRNRHWKWAIERTAWVLILCLSVQHISLSYFWVRKVDWSAVEHFQQRIVNSCSYSKWGRERNDDSS